jgi:hypothetical protein
MSRQVLLPLVATDAQRVRRDRSSGSYKGTSATPQSKMFDLEIFAGRRRGLAK